MIVKARALQAILGYVVLMGLAARPALAEPHVVSAFDCRLATQSRSGEALQATFRINEARIRAATESLGLTSTQYARFRTAFESPLQLVTMPKHLGAITAGSGDTAGAVRDVIVPDGEQAIHIDLVSVDETISLFVPTACDDLSVVGATFFKHETAAMIDRPGTDDSFDRGVKGGPGGAGVGSGDLTAPTSTPPPTTEVNISTLAVYNSRRPEHAAAAPYFGRYTYVLLRGGSDMLEKDRALLTALYDQSLIGGTISVGAPTGLSNQLSYNLFLVPGTDDARDVSGPEAGAVAQLLERYDFGRAASVRIAYCNNPSHRGRKNSVCHSPWDRGPILLTFVHPYRETQSGEPYPHAFAYDFSNVAVSQYANAVKTIERQITIPDSIVADRVLPPDVVAAVLQPGLDQLADALTRAVQGVGIFMDIFPAKVSHPGE